MLGLLPGCHPGLVAPLVIVDIPDNGGVVWPQLRVIAIGVRFQHGVAVFGLYLVLVHRAFVQPGDKQLKHTGIPQPSHLVTPPVPYIKIPHHADPHGTGSPDREIHALYALDLHNMSAQLLIGVVVDSRGEFAQLLLTDLGLVGIGITHLPHIPVVIGNRQSILGNGLAGNQRGEKSGLVRHLHGILFPSLNLHRYGSRCGDERLHQQPILRHMRP